MGKLRAGMHKILYENNVEAGMVEKEQKTLVTYLVDGLAPNSFRQAVKTQLSYEESKKLHSDVVAFYYCTLELMKSRMLWQPASRERSSKP